MTTSSVTTKSFAPGTSRGRRDTRTLQAQFDDWLAQVADDNDTARAERLTALFERSGFNRQKDLAEAVDVETRTVQRWLAGEGIAKRHWDDLARVLDTSVGYLIFGETDPARIDESQLDRIEAKLDEILSRLPPDQLHTAFEQEADQRDDRQQQSDATRKRTPRKRKDS